MARILTETYSSGSFINGKTADVGGTWAVVANAFDSGTDMPISAGRVTVSDVAIVAFKNSAVHGSANEDATVEFTPTADNWVVGVTLRRNTSTGAQYLIEMGFGGSLAVRYLSSGTAWPGTVVGSGTHSIAASNRASHTLRASVTGSTLRAWIDGTAVTFTETSTTTVTDTNLSAVGEVGWWGRAISSTQITSDDDLAGGDTTPPVITGPGGATGSSSSISVAENTTAVHTFTANESVTWSLNGGADVARFSISAGGALSFLTAPDFESPTDADTNNTYVVGVRATDGAGNNTTQTCTVTVTNASEPPLAPSIGTATAGNASASVTFTPPTNTGRPAITGYTATSSPGGLTGTGTSSPITVSGLTNGVAYTFTVTATNSEGTGPASAASNSVTPSSGTSAPVITAHPSPVSVTAGAAATFTAAASGSPTPTVQWQRNGVDISGATSTSYTTPATTVTGGSANNGDTYRAVFTNGSGTATTNAATLTVNAPGTAALTLSGFKTWTGVPYTSTSVNFVKVCRISTGATVLELAGQTINSSGVMSIVSNALVPGASYMVFGFNDDGSLSFKVRATAV